MGTLDHAFNALRTLGGRLRFFRGGWGHVERHRPWLASVRAGPLAPPSLDIVWRTLAPGVSLGEFASPGADYLPPASGLARFLHVSPATESPPTVLLLAATGDHGFLRRFGTLSWRLRRHGIASLVLESPFYGRRAPPTQGGARLERVAHLADLGRATIEEGVALLDHFRRAGCRRVAVSGVSQGGLHAAMVASQTKFPTPVVMGFAPHSAAPVFTEGVLAKNVDWAALRADAVERSRAFAEGDERSCLREALDQASIDKFPEHGVPARHVLLFGRADG